MSRMISLFEPVPADLVERVENAKRDQADLMAVKLAGLGFDEAVYEAARASLHRKLEAAARMGAIYPGATILKDWRDFCMAQIPEVVDLWLQRLFHMGSALAGHDEYTEGRNRVLSPHHDVLKQRAKRLVNTLEDGRWEPKAATQRARAVCLVSAGRMNRTNWDELAVAFCAAR